MKNEKSYSTLREIIEAVGPSDKIGASGTYVGFNYTKEELVKDLERIERMQRTPSFYDTNRRNLYDPAGFRGQFKR